MRVGLALLFVLCSLTAIVLGEDSPQTLVHRLRHLRIDGPREWTEFPAKPEGSKLEIDFHSPLNPIEWSLEVRQQDLKQTWNVFLNDKSLGRLVRDENDMVVYFSVPVGAIRDGQNTIRIEQDVRRRKIPDDIRVGQIKLHSRQMEAVLNESILEIEVIDKDTSDHIPSRGILLGKAEPISNATTRTLARSTWMKPLTTFDMDV